MTVDLAILVREVAAAGFPEPVPEYPFHPTRRWRFDLGWPALLVAFEREGMAAGGNPGRHQRAGGYRADCHKYNAAQILGWLVVRGTAAMLRDGTALDELTAALAARSERKPT